jgi:hypothetical protein
VSSVRVMASSSQREPGQPPENGYQMSVPKIPGITDSELIVYVVREAQSVLAQHIERGPRDAEETISSLLEILDRQDVVAATERLCREYGLRPLK